MAITLVPPGGFAGFSQMTPASKVALGARGTASGGAGRARKRRTARGKASSRKRRKGSKRMKFGSPAWQKKYRVGKFAKKRRR